MKKFSRQLICKGNRQDSILRIKQLIFDSHGFIMHHEMFSDLAMSLSVQVEGKHLGLLRESLLSAGVLTEQGSRPSDNQVLTSTPNDKTLISDPETEWTVLLGIHFADGTGELEHTVPEVEQ